MARLLLWCALWVVVHTQRQLVALNLSLNVNFADVTSGLDGVSGWERRVKAEVVKVLGDPHVEIETSYAAPLAPAGVALVVLLQASRATQFVSWLATNRTMPPCSGALCNFTAVLSNTNQTECPNVGWATTCPAYCVSDECADKDNSNNACILSEDWSDYTCSCLSMAYSTGPGGKSCVRLPEVSSTGVIAVAVVCLLAALICMLVVWRVYVKYQRTLKKRPEPYRGYARPSRVNTLARIPKDNPTPTGRISTGGQRTSTSRNNPPTPVSGRSQSKAALVSEKSTRRLSGKAKPSNPQVELDPFKHSVNNNFQQMNFGGRKVRFSHMKAITVFVSAGCGLIPAGLGLLIVTGDIARQEIRYDNAVDCDLNVVPRGSVCRVNLTVESDMPAPIHVHYRLVNFYQNHRSYVMSRDEKQLRAADADDNQLPNCEPLITGFNGTHSPIAPPGVGAPTYLDNETSKFRLYPCGLVAQSWFNDVISGCLITQNETFCEPFRGTNWAKSEIVYEWDKSKKFQARALRGNETRWNAMFGYEMPSLDNEDFMAWMRVAPWPAFSKLYRQVQERNFRKGDQVVFTITNNFPVHAFEGEKYVVISTASFFGGKTRFLGGMYVVVGVASTVFALILWLFGGETPYYHEVLRTGCKCCQSNRPKRISDQPMGGGFRIE